MNFRQGSRDEPEINLIPFIDVLLVVLIFLMLSTTYSKFTELQIKLPIADAEQQRDYPKEVIVSVGSDGRYSINRIPVEQPLSYFSQVSHEAGWILPIFYYLHLAGQTRKGAMTALKASKIAKPKTRDELVKLLNSKRTLYSKLGGNRSATFNRIVNTRDIQITTSHQAKEICSALTGVGEADRGSFDHFHDLLRMSLAVWDTSDGDRDLLSYIRRASARLDELEYGTLVPAE